MKVLLHICCGICACAAVSELMCEGHTVTGFFYNPNIHPADEYTRRLETAQEVAQRLGFELVEDRYDRERWFELVKGKEYEPEGGARCEICFTMRLERTYQYFRKKEIFNVFTTTLTSSPHKDAALINEIGRRIGGECFLAKDFKKKDGFKRGMELAREWNLYHQKYCGCIYSLESVLAKDRSKK